MEALEYMMRVHNICAEYNYGEKRCVGCPLAFEYPFEDGKLLCRAKALIGTKESFEETLEIVSTYRGEVNHFCGYIKN